jgi:hypothetical protein
VRGVDQAKHAILNEVADVDRIRHRRRHPARQGFDKRKSRDNSTILAGCHWLDAHWSLQMSFEDGFRGHESPPQFPTSARCRNRNTNS